MSRLVLPLPDGPITAVSDRGAKDDVNPVRILGGLFLHGLRREEEVVEVETMTLASSED